MFWQWYWQVTPRATRNHTRIFFMLLTKFSEIIDDVIGKPSLRNIWKTYKLKS